VRFHYLQQPSIFGDKLLLRRSPGIPVYTHPFVVDSELLVSLPQVIHTPQWVTGALMVYEVDTLFQAEMSNSIKIILLELWHRSQGLNAHIWLYFPLSKWLAGP